MADTAPLPPPPAPPPAVPTDPAFLASHARMGAALEAQAGQMARAADAHNALKAYFASRDVVAAADARRDELVRISIAIMGERMTASVKPNFDTVVADAAALQAAVDKRLSGSPVTFTNP